MIVAPDHEEPVIRSGALSVRGGEILAIGTAAKVAGIISCPAETFFSDLTLLPGMVDGQTHLFRTLGKTPGDGLTLLPWLQTFMMPPR